MGEYKYRLVKEEQWHFELLPSNNNDCYVAKSSCYKNKDDALKGISRFKNFLNSNTDFKVENREIEESKGIKRYWSFFYFSETEIFSTRPYFQKAQRSKGIERIVKNRNADLRSELNIE